MKLRHVCVSGAALVCALLSQGALAQGQAAAPATPPTLADLAARFGAREFIGSVSLSPDGHRLVLVENLADGGEQLATADLEAGGTPKPIMHSPGGEAHLTSCFWPTDMRLICTMHYTVQGVSHPDSIHRLFTLNADGTDAKKLTADTTSRSAYAVLDGGAVIDQTGGDKPGTVLMMRQFVPDVSQVTILASKAEGYGVEKVDVTSLSRNLVEAARKEAVAYISDGLGHVRLRADRDSDLNGYDKDYVDWFYRKSGTHEWQTLGRVKYDGGLFTGFEPERVDPALDVVYGFDNKDGMNALYRIKLDGSMTRELVLARSDVDVDELLTIGRQRRVVGAAYATDRRQVEFFDPELKRLGAALGHALPGQPEIAFLDASADEKQLLLLATSDTNPGMIYRFDKTSHHLEELLPLRPELQGMTLATMKPISFAARDGSQVPAYLTLPPGSTGKGLPAIVMPHGGPGARDEWGFDWLVQFFAARGFAVLQPNFRGSSGYGAAWFQKNGFQSWKSAIGDVDDAGKWLVQQGIADPAKMAIVGWSYGGYAALQSGVYEPGLYKAIVAIAPVTDLAALVSSESDFTDYYQLRGMIGTGPHVQEGSPAQHAAAISVPVLMFQGTWDQNVPISQSRLMLGKLKAAGKNADLVEFPKLDHQIDNTAARTAMLTRTDTFLRQAMGM